MLFFLCEVLINLALFFQVFGHPLCLVPHTINVNLLLLWCQLIWTHMNNSQEKSFNEKNIFVEFDSWLRKVLDTFLVPIPTRKQVVDYSGQHFEKHKNTVFDAATQHRCSKNKIDARVSANLDVTFLILISQ